MACLSLRSLPLLFRPSLPCLFAPDKPPFGFCPSCPSDRDKLLPKFGSFCLSALHRLPFGSGLSCLCAAHSLLLTFGLSCPSVPDTVPLRFALYCPLPDKAPPRSFCRQLQRLSDALWAAPPAVLFVPAFSFAVYLVLAARRQRTRPQDCKLR